METAAAHLKETQLYFPTCQVMVSIFPLGFDLNKVHLLLLLLLLLLLASSFQLVAKPRIAVWATPGLGLHIAS